MEPTRTHLLDLPAPCFEGQPPRTEAVKPWRKRLADACGEWDDLRPPRRERQPARVNHETAEHVRARLGIGQSVPVIAKALGLAESDIEKLVKRIKDKATPARKHSCASKHSPARKNPAKNTQKAPETAAISAAVIEEVPMTMPIAREPEIRAHTLDWQRRQAAYLFTPCPDECRPKKKPNKRRVRAFTPEQSALLLHANVNPDYGRTDGHGRVKPAGCECLKWPCRCGASWRDSPFNPFIR